MKAKFLLALTAIAATATLAACSPKPAADTSTASSESSATVMSDMSGMAGMSDMSGMAMEPGAKMGSGVGVITEIDKSAGTLTIKHDAIPAVDWPAMTMAFKAAPPSLLDGLKVGEKIKFDVKVNGSDAEVTAVAPQ